MRTLAQTAIVAAVLLVATGACAQQIATIGKEVPDDKLKLQWEKGEEEIYLFRELRGGIAVFYFWRSGNVDSLERLSEMTELHRKYGSKGVRFLSVTADNEERFKKVAEERDLSAFRYAFWNATSLYYLLGALSDPYVVFIDPRGILAWRGVPDGRLEERLADLHARTDPPAGNDEWLGRRFRQAERLYDQGEYGRAYTIARNLFKITDEAHAVHGKAEALMEKCQAAAEEWLKEAIQAERDKDYQEAARIVAEIAVRFEDPDEQQDKKKKSGGRDEEQSIKRRAEHEIGRMNGNRQLKKLIRQARENAEGQLLNNQAAALEEDEYFIDAKHIYEQVLKDYEDTDAAEEARRRLRRIRRDPSIQKKIAERRARDEAVRWLDLADRFAAIELYDEAREYYQNVLREHSDTTAARRARQRLSELPQPQAKAQADADSERSSTKRQP